jgi:hypothetical protein
MAEISSARETELREPLKPAAAFADGAAAYPAGAPAEFWRQKISSTCRCSRCVAMLWQKFLHMMLQYTCAAPAQLSECRALQRTLVTFGVGLALLLSTN